MQVLPRKVGEKYQYHIRKALETCRMQVFEYQLDFPEGPRYYEGRMVVSGKNETLTIVRNITESKGMENDLKEAYNIINRSLAVAFLWKNLVEWPVEFVSDNVVDLFGFSARRIYIRPSILCKDRPS